MARAVLVCFGLLGLFFIGLGVLDAGVDSQYFVSPNRGELGYAGITGSTGASASTVLTTTMPSILVAVENTTDAEVMLVRGTTDFKRVPASSFRVFDLKANAVGFAAGTWRVYYSSAPTSGYVEVVAVPYR